jgi:hypothetical protein
VGTADNFLHQLRLDVNLNLDATMISPEAGVIKGEFHFLTDIAQHNESFTVTPPTDFRPMEELQSQLDAATSGMGM